MPQLSSLCLQPHLNKQNEGLGFNQTRRGMYSGQAIDIGADPNWDPVTNQYNHSAKSVSSAKIVEMIEASKKGSSS